MECVHRSAFSLIETVVVGKEQYVESCIAYGIEETVGGTERGVTAKTVLVYGCLKVGNGKVVALDLF